MDAIADSNAVRDDKRVLPQHQAALVLLQGLVSDPKVQSISWFDIACGRGQILGGVGDALSVTSRKKIDYLGYDLRHDYVCETEKLASTSGLHSYLVRVGDLTDVGKLIGDQKFDFITFTNTVHEVHPRNLALVLVDAVLRLAPEGKLFIYDMETINPPELGAVPWSAAEMTEIVRHMTSALGLDGYDPPVGHWPHSTCNAWSVQIQRDHLAKSDDELASLRTGTETSTEGVITDLLRLKYSRCQVVLENLTKYGPETFDDQTTKKTLLYEFWAISRALEGCK